MNIQTIGVYFIIAVILLNTPVIGKYIAILHTLIHEIGHAIMAIITGGKVASIKLFANTSGEAWSENTRFGRILTTIVGYPFASVVSVILLKLLSEENYTLIMIIITTFVVVSFILWIRNVYGLIWVISFIYILYQVITANNPTIIIHLVTLLVCIIFIEAIQKAFTIFILSIRDPRNAGDASSLRRSTIIIPTQVWGLFFLIQALILSGYGIYHYIL